MIFLALSHEGCLSVCHVPFWHPTNESIQNSLALPFLPDLLCFHPQVMAQQARDADRAAAATAEGAGVSGTGYTPPNWAGVPTGVQYSVEVRMLLCFCFCCVCVCACVLGRADRKSVM